MSASKSKPAPVVGRLLYDMDETAYRLNRCRTGLYADMATGELEYVQIGDRRFTTEDQQLAYVERKLQKSAA